MNTFSEIYNTYFHITSEILTKNGSLSKAEICNIISELGYTESLLYLVPKLTDETGWQLLEKDSNNSRLYHSVLNGSFTLPVSILQKRWLKTLLNDERIQLFMEDSEIRELLANLKDVEPLFDKSDFHYYDCFSDGDNFSDASYRQNFKTILYAIKNHEYIAIEFQSHKARRVNHWFYPAKLEYSIRNNVFRLYAIEARNRSHHKFFTINIGRICSVKPTGHHPEFLPDIDEYITNSYTTEPVTVLIKNERNALERAMLQFANYKKNTSYVHDNIYKCEIFYNKSNETELLIEILSYGPLMKVIGNEHFLKLIGDRLRSQRALIDFEDTDDVVEF